MAETATTEKRRQKRYPEYKDSGVEWLDGIPEYWEVIRLRYLLETSPSKSEVSGLPDDVDVSFVPMEAVGEEGGLDLSQTKDLTQVVDGYTYFRDGDVLVAKITPCFENGKAALADKLKNGIGFGTTELHVLRASDKLNNGFLFYLAVSHPFRNMGEATMYGAGGQKRVPDDFIQNLRWPLPPLDEQCTIAAYLDRETERIDALVAKKERLIELLEEKRTALISRTVTKGLDPDVEMQDSGVEWLGEIPAHWEVSQIRRNWEVIDCKHRTAEYVDEGIPILSTTEVKPGRVVLQGARQTTQEEFEDLTEGGRLPRRGDVIYSRNASVGAAAYVDTDEKFCMGQDVCLIRSERQNQLFLSYQLISPIVLSQLEAIMVGATFRRINVSQINRLLVAVPPISEQCDISNYLDEHTTRIDALIDKVQEGIERLKEYRTALISAAVTGQIDVRGAFME